MECNAGKGRAEVPAVSKKMEEKEMKLCRYIKRRKEHHVGRRMMELNVV